MSDSTGGPSGSGPPPPPPPPPPPQPPYQNPQGYGGGYGQQGYGQQWQPQGQYQPPPSTNGLAIASMVLGILWLWWIGSILALVFGYVSKKQIDESQGRQGGRGMAVAGIVLGWIGVGFLMLGVLFGFLGAVM